MSRITQPLPRRAARFAHLTDIHLTHRSSAPAGLALALRLAAALDPPPDFLVTGGDHIGDALEARARDAVDAQWDLYTQALALHNTLPVRPVLGNHDVWGWLAPDVSPDTPGYGKAMALDRLQLPRPYYAFDHGGWHFIVLDSTALRGAMYAGEIDAEQLDWLRADLAANTKPACVFTHIPVLTVCAFHPPGFNRDDHYHVPHAWMHADALPLARLFAAHGVRLCVSGHLHMVDRVEFLGVTYICDGSVCGRWWQGPYAEFPEGFGVFDLFEDGTFTHRYVPLGWDAGAAVNR